jgi:hypothetical protein
LIIDLSLQPSKSRFIFSYVILAAQQDMFHFLHQIGVHLQTDTMSAAATFEDGVSFMIEHKARNF